MFQILVNRDSNSQLTSYPDYWLPITDNWQPHGIISDMFSLRSFGVGIVIGAAATLMYASASSHAIPMVKGVFTTPTPTPTPSSTPTPTATPTITPTPNPTRTPTPTFTPSPTPIPITSQQLDEWFEKYSKEYSVDKSRLWNVAVCESKLRPNAKNGDYLGLYQFSTRTWQSTRRAMNMDDHPELRRNPEESIRTAAFKIATEGLKSWPNCGK